MRLIHVSSWLRAALTLVLVVGSALVLSTAHAATTYVVDREDDSVEKACTAASNDCGLRGAILAANLNPGADIITLPAGLYTLAISGPGDDQGTLGDLDIRGDLTINGAGALQTVIAGGSGWNDRLLHVAANVTVTINGVTIRSGRPGASRGGNVLNQGTLTLTNSEIRDGLSSASGGALANDGTLTLAGSTISGSTASGNGGGIDNAGTLNLTNTTISGNTAATGGGIFNAGGVTLNGVTVSNNTATSGSGGGVSNASGSPFALRNTILAGNFGSASPDCAGTLISQSYNLLGKVGTCVLSSATGDLKNVNAQLGPLRDNGGPTFTHELRPGSAALDAGNPGSTGGAGCPATDQRGVARPQTGRCDIGAFEAVGILISEFKFLPFSLTVRAGTFVRWKNAGSLAHATTSTNQSPSGDRWNSWNLEPGDTFSYRFLMPTGVGTSYTYYCRIHPQSNMNGQIFVVGPAAQPELLITRLSPNAAPAGSPTLQLAIDGLAIADGAKVRFNGVELTPRIVSPPDQVIVDIPANLLTTPGEASVTVVNPGSSTISNILPFTILGEQQRVYLPLVSREGQ